MSQQQKILVVDDDADIREVLNIQLTNEGYDVLEAVNGTDAIETVIRNSDIDLVILDVMMPGISGVEACTEIRKHSCVPVLFLTAKSKESDKAEAYDNGGDDYLVKPFSRAELMMKVRSLMRRYVVYRGKQENDISGKQGLVSVQDIVVNREKRTLARDGKPFRSQVRNIRFSSTCWITEAVPAALRRFTKASGKKNFCRHRRAL